MRKHRSVLTLFALIIPFILSAQIACDTVKVRDLLNRIQEREDSGDWDSAIDASHDAVDAARLCTQYPDLLEETQHQAAECHLSFAFDLLQRGLFNRSIDMSERAIALEHQCAKPDPAQIARGYQILSSDHTINGNPQLGSEMAEKALLTRQEANPKDPKISAHLNQLVNNAIVLSDTANARKWLLEWEDFHRLIGKAAGPVSRIGLAAQWAEYYDWRGDDKMAIRILEDTLNRYGEMAKARGVFLGITEFRLCEYYTADRAFDKALQLSERNVAYFEAKMQKEKGRLFSRAHYAWCLAQSARAAWNIYANTGDSTMRALAETRCQQAESVVRAMRDRAPDDGFRDWLSNTVGITSNLTEVRYGFYAETRDFTHIERAFETREAEKAFNVQEFLHETNALRWGGLPDSLSEKETSYRNAVNELETNFFMMRSRPNADSLMAQNEQQLFVLRDEYRHFLSGLEKQFPEYYRLKYRQTGIHLQQVQQQLLKPGQCLLDLSLDNGYLFTLLIRPDTVLWQAFPLDSSFEHALTVMEQEQRDFASNQGLPEQAYLAHLQTFADASYTVYCGLIKPLRIHLKEEVILIPRNTLAYLPFGALLTRKESDMARPQQWHYLDEELVLSQTYSAGLFAFVQERRSPVLPKGSVLAVAPFFEGEISRELQLPVGETASFNRSDLFQPLPNSGAEARAVAEMNGGKCLLGKEAEKSAFIAASKDYRILHLATHSAANEVLGEYSFAAFQTGEKNGKIDPLYARDIYGLQLSADLVVLSACETALGQYRSDEGIVGLVRAFTCAGARNVVASLWSVNDSSTRDLMLLFYGEIKKGQPYNKALANAKRAFIRDNRSRAHPYYWAGFVLNGR